MPTDEWPYRRAETLESRRDRSSYSPSHPQIYEYLPLSSRKRARIRVPRDEFVRWYLGSIVRPLTVEDVMSEETDILAELAELKGKRRAG